MTLVELMIAIFLSTIIIIGAFHIQATFQYSLHRQDEVTRIQQTMKVTRRMLERRLRSAGAGLMANSVHWCGGEQQAGPFVFHNNNTFGGTDDSEGSNNDNDPDFFEIMSADRSMSGYLTKQHPITGVVKEVDKPQNFQEGALMGIPGPNGVCIFMIRKINNGKLDYGSGGSALTKCYNDKQACRQDILGYNQLPMGTEILNFSSGTFALRIDNSQPARPVLMMASGVAGGDPSVYEWQPVAVNVEDMQIGLYVDTSNPADQIGDIWVNQRDLTQAELSRVRAIRISLVFRSASEIPGWRAGRRR